MHATEREELILNLLRLKGFVGFQELERRVKGSAATLRRDLGRLEEQGKLVRVRGGAKRTEEESSPPSQLSGASFQENVSRNRKEKEAIGKAAAALCQPGESIIIDGGSTTFQMCAHLEPLRLHVLTNSLYIVSALLPHRATHVSMPAGALYREQNILLSPFEDDGMGRYRASKLFMGAASIGPHGLMQSDAVLVQVERRLLGRAQEMIVLVDSSKFDAPTGHTVCPLSDIDVVITDSRIAQKHLKMLKKAGVKTIVVDPDAKQIR